MIQKISIWGLRGFGTEQTLEFARPDGETEGSGLTFLVGGNNSGKTTVLEALRAFNCQGTPPSFSERKRNKRCREGEVHLKLTDGEGNEYAVDTAARGGSPTELRVNGELQEEGAAWQLPPVFVLPSRRFAEYEFGRTDMTREYYLRHQHSSYFNRSSTLIEFSARLFRMYRHKEEFDGLLKEVLGYDLNWTIEQNENGNYFLKLNVGGCDHSSEGMGDGVWSIFTLCDALYDSSPGETVAIDEPELSLHPAYQKKVMALLKRYARDRQIILSTHSPYFIDLESLCGGAGLYRTRKERNGDIRVYPLSPGVKKELGGFLRNINQPHTLGAEARELFFLEDRVIVVEGQEDVVMYPLAARQAGVELRGTFFGWGAGGAGNIPKILRLLRDLGYEKVCVIFDGDKGAEAAKTEAEFPQYRVYSISAADIRDKDAVVNRPAKAGMMEQNGRLKPKHAEEMKNLLERINRDLSEQAGCV